MTKKIYFIADTHLSIKDSEAERKKRDYLLTFLKRIEGTADELFIIGDFFDFWFEWYHVIPKYYFPFLYQLKTLSLSGVKLHFITGNHDFYPGTFLRENIGLECYHESAVIERGGKRFFLGHGDGYARRDRGYRFLKKMIRNKLSIFIFRTFISADLGVQLAKWTSGSSRKLKTINKEEWLQEYLSFARNKFSLGFDYVLLGHLHYPRLCKEGNNIFLSMGDWISYYSYGEFDGRELRLKYFKDSR